MRIGDKVKLNSLAKELLIERQNTAWLPWMNDSYTITDGDFSKPLSWRIVGPHVGGYWLEEHLRHDSGIDCLCDPDGPFQPECLDCIPALCP